MKEVLSWFVEHYELLILIVACLLDIVLFLFGVFKKKVDPSVSQVITNIPYFISVAESKFGAGNGKLKKDFVVESACKLYEKITDVYPNLRSTIRKVFDCAVEDILSTPQKKGK